LRDRLRPVKRVSVPRDIQEGEKKVMKKGKPLLIFCLALFAALPLRAQTNSGVNNAELNGNYAFSFNGHTTGGGGASTVFGAVGRFTADGAGNLLNGEIDSNGAGATDRLMAQAFTGTYSIGPDHRGVMSLNIPGGGTLAFAMTANGNAQFIEADASGGHGTVGSGSIEKADTTAFSTANIVGDYAFGFAGLDGFNSRSAMAGRITANGAGIFTNGLADVNQSGRFTSAAMIPMGHYIVSDVATGRGSIVLPPPAGGVPPNLNFVFYMINSAKLFVMEVDAVTVATPLLNGVFLQQQTPVGGFSNAALNGSMVMFLTGRALCGSGGSPASNVVAGLFTSNGLGGTSLTYDENCGGTPTSASLAGTYTITPNGRVGMQLSGDSVVAYMVSTNQAVFIVPDSSALFGFGEPQSAGALSNATVSGRYSASATTPAALGVTIFSGEFTADGASPTGTLTGSEDIGAPSGQTWGAPASSTYTITSAPANGRGTMSGNIAGSGVLYLISPSRFVAISLTDANPAVLLFQQ
jgi:hypothetical protein